MAHVFVIEVIVCRAYVDSRTGIHSMTPEMHVSSAAGAAGSEPVSISARAAKRINSVLAKEPEGAMLRIAVNGGGCSGFQYAFEITQEKAEDDLVIERDGAFVVIDLTSLEYLKGSEVDFVDDLIGQSFKIHNPNAVSSCGCGTSFSV
jgi:iron-sulfur cluster assembly accessory protein